MSSNSKTSSASGGVGFFGLLAIVFIVLKLLDKITWSWLWVLSPIWIPIAVTVILLVLIFAVQIIKAIVKHKRRVSRHGKMRDM